MSPVLSNLVNAIAPSATLATTDRARRLREQGINVIALAAGQPDFDTPQHIKDAATAALAAGDTKYPTPVSGTTPLRKAVREYLARYSQLEYGLDDICVTVGCKDALHLAFAAILNPGDEVLVPVPYWVSYPDQIRMTGAKPVYLPSNAQGKLSPAVLKAAITPRSRLFVMNSPSNPSGAVYSHDELAAIADVLRGTDILVVSDEIYHRLTFDAPSAVSFATLAGMHERTVTINGVSKTYAMTGWRLGFAAGPATIIEGMARLQGQTTSGAASFVQTATIAALSGPQESVDRMREAFRRRSQTMCAALRAMPGVKLIEPRGAFFCFPDVSGTFARLGVRNADEFAEAALERAHLALISGSAFGCPTHVRLSYAISDEQVAEAMARLGRMLAS